MKNIQKQLSKCVIALCFITGFQCAAPVVAVIFIPLIAAKQWTNVLDSTNTFFFIVAQDSTNKSSFTGNENLPDGTQAAFAGAFEDVTIDVAADSPLAKVGGSQIVDSSAGKIIVLHEADDKYLAFSAKCTHKGGLVEYDAASNKLTCPKHGSAFDGVDGKVLKGPADEPLKAYPAKAADKKVTVTVA